MEMQPVVVQAHFPPRRVEIWICGKREKCIGKFKLNCFHFFRCVEIGIWGWEKMSLTRFVRFNAAVSGYRVSNYEKLQKVIHFCDFVILLNFFPAH